MAAPERLGVGAVGERDLDLHEHVAGPRPRGGHVLEPHVARPVEAERSHGVKTTLSASRRRYSSSPSAKRSSGSTVGSGSSRSGSSAHRLAHGLRRGGARADERELAAVDGGRRDRARVCEDEHGPAGLHGLDCRLGAALRADHRSTDGAVRSRPARFGSLSTANTSSPRRASTSREQPADEAVADDQHAARRHPIRATQDAGERLDRRPGASPRPSGSSTQPARARARRSRPAGSSASRTPRRSTRGRRDSARTHRRGRDGRAPPGRRRRRATTSCPSTVPACARVRASRRPSRRARTRARSRARRALGLRHLGQRRLAGRVQYDSAHAEYRRSLTSRRTAMAVKLHRPAWAQALRRSELEGAAGARRPGHRVRGREEQPRGS